MEIWKERYDRSTHFSGILFYIVRKTGRHNSILVICQELFEKDFDMFFRKKGNFNRPSDMLCTKPNVSST